MFGSLIAGYVCSHSCDVSIRRQRQVCIRGSFWVFLGASWGFLGVSLGVFRGRFLGVLGVSWGLMSRGALGSAAKV